MAVLSLSCHLTASTCIAHLALTLTTLTKPSNRQMYLIGLTRCSVSRSLQEYCGCTQVLTPMTYLAHTAPLVDVDRHSHTQG
jgi:hypothetical protein